MCQPGSGKWPTIVEALNQLDKKDLIFKTMRDLEKRFKTLSKPFNDRFAPQWQMLLQGAIPGQILDHKVPAFLKLLPSETEVFYQIHYACFAMETNCNEEIIEPVKSLAFESILRRDTREKTASVLREMIFKKVTWIAQSKLMLLG